MLVFGVLRYQWYIVEIAALFVALGVAMGAVGGLGGNETARAFMAGVRDLAPTALIIGLAEQFGSVYAPTYAGVLTFVIMVLVLAWRQSQIYTSLTMPIGDLGILPSIAPMKRTAHTCVSAPTLSP